MIFKKSITWVVSTWAGRLGVALGAVLMSCALGFAAWSQVSRVGVRLVNQAVAQLSRKLGTPVLVGKVDLETFPFLVALEDIRVGPEAQVVISRIQIDLGLNLWSSSLVDIDEIGIERFDLKMTEDHLRTMLPPVGAAVPSGGDGSLVSLQRLIDKLFAAMPSRRLVIAGAELTLLNTQGEPTLRVRDVKLAIDRSAGEAVFRIARLRTQSGLNEGHLYGRVELNSNAPDYRFFVKSKGNANANKTIWSASGLVQKDLSQVQLNMAFHRRPSFLEAWLRGQPMQLTRLRSRLQIELTKAMGGWQFTAQMQSLGSTLRLPLLSSREIGPLFFELRANGSFQPKSRSLTFDAATLTLPGRVSRAFGENPLRLAARFQASLSDEAPANLSIRGQVMLPTTSCQTVIEASPDGLLPLIEGFKLGGDTAATLAFEAQSQNLESSRFDLQDAIFGCRVLEAPYAFTAEHLNGPLAVERQVEPDAPKMTVSLDRQAPTFASFAAIGKNAQVAFVSSEDASFYWHKGIDASALVSALRRDLAEGRVAAGGSTITMQTVKNLFLTPERTVSRKMQELFLAWHLEHTLSKERILELYMNVAELGPGIFGIGPAAEHFFAKPAAELTLLEAAYLATLLPNPKGRYRYFCKGDLTPNYRELVHGLLRRMLSHGRISSGRYLQAMNSSLHFNEDQRLAAKDCNDPPKASGEATELRPESAYLFRRPRGGTAHE